MRIAVLTSTLLLTAVIAALTIADVVRNGFTPLAFLAILVLTLFMIGIVGALRHPPDE